MKVDCLSILLQSGADPTIESFDGESIFQLADQYDNPHINSVLQAHRDQSLQLPAKQQSSDFKLSPLRKELKEIENEPDENPFTPRGINLKD